MTCLYIAWMGRFREVSTWKPATGKPVFVASEGTPPWQRTWSKTYLGTFGA